MSGKGDKPRPFAVDQDTFGANWALVFGEAAERRGVAERSNAIGSNPTQTVGSNPTAAAIYVDNATG